MAFSMKNMSVFKPKNVAIGLAVLALLQSFGVQIFDRHLFDLGGFPVTVGILLAAVFLIGFWRDGMK